MVVQRYTYIHTDVHPLLHSGGAREYMNMQGFPVGLQNTFIASLAKFPMRYYIIDDSGSMERMDGKKIVNQSGRKT
jgi:hypothetical protein